MSQLAFQFNGKIIRHGDPTRLCGIINVTPDSFSDGGLYFGVQQAVEQAKRLIEQGAHMLDIGGESTRPGSTYVAIEEEIERVVPVIQAIREFSDIPISIDTWKAPVAKAAIEAGADIINDITGLLGDPAMVEVLAASQAGAILMFNPVIARPHHPGSQIFPKFGAADIFAEAELTAFTSMAIVDVMQVYFKKSLALAQQHGISPQRLMLDPGIGFGLTKRENLTLIHQLACLHEMGYTVFLGVSRKRFIMNLLEENGFDVDVTGATGWANRDQASAALTTIAAVNGVEVVRVHQIPAHKMAAIVGDAVRLAEDMADINFQAYQKPAKA